MLKLLLLMMLAMPAKAGVYYENKLSTVTGRASMTQSGTICLAASSATSNTCTILLDGPTGRVDGYDLSAQFQAIAVSTALPRGHDIEDEGVDLPLRSTINFVGGGVTVTDSGGKTVVTIGQLGDILRSTATRTGTITTASTAWSTMSGSTLTLAMSSAQYVAANFSCNLECLDYTQCGVSFGLLVDGAHVSGQTASTSSGFLYMETPASTTDSPVPVSFRTKTSNKLSAGTHTLSLLWASTGGVTVKAGRNTGGCSIEYAEAPELWNTATSGAGGAGPGVTDIGSQSQAGLQSYACSVLPCQAQGNFGLYDIWVATGTGAGQWMNIRTGTGPY